LAEISKIFFSDTTWRMELKIGMNDIFLARSLSSGVTFCSDCPPFKMAAVTKNRNFFNCPLLL
jgi:hypothetical protein